MKRALLVGLNNYPGKENQLECCVQDAKEMARVLSVNEDGSKNFECTTLVSSDNLVRRVDLRKEITRLFEGEGDIALFFFSGHALLTANGGVLVTEDTDPFDEGVGMNELLNPASASKFKEIVIVLDCCHSGALGNILGSAAETSALRKGVSFLTACSSEQSSLEGEGIGVFTGPVIDALEGGASDVLGQVTIASVYGYVDEVLGAEDQRPLFKANVSRLTPLRQCAPQVARDILRKLPHYFPEEHYELPLNPSFEPTSEYTPRNRENERIFGELQKMRAVRLVEPHSSEEHMYYAAMNSKSCHLTPLGRFYRKLAIQGSI